MSLSHPIRRATAMLKPLALAAGVLLAAALPAAEAGVIVQNRSFSAGGDFVRALPLPPAVVPYGRDLKDGVDEGGTLSFDRFDASMGTLTGVTWELVDATMGFQLAHNAGVRSFDPATVVMQLTLAGRVDQAGNVGGKSLLGTVGQSFNLSQSKAGACTVVGGLAPPSYALGCGLPIDAKMSAADKIGADVSAFVGDGIFTEEVLQNLDWSDRIDLALLNLTGAALPPVLTRADVAGDFYFKGMLRLTYNYEAAPPAGVPEPGTLWMVAGLLPLLVLRGRRHGR